MMQKKVCLITGATSGVGKATAHALAASGATTILVARNEKLGGEVLQEITTKTGNRDCGLLIADLSDQASVRKLADTFLSRYDKLNLLVNNAGLAMKKRTLSSDGIEMTFAVNHLAYFMLTNLLLEKLKQSAPSHIINVSSEAHRNVIFDFDNLQGEKKFSGFGAYSITKLCNVLFSYELAKKLQGTGVTVNAVHPGYLNTGIFRETPGYFRLLVRLTAGRPQKGADAILHVAELAERNHISGKYFSGQKEARSSGISYDTAAAERLWRLSEKLTGLVPSD